MTPSVPRDEPEAASQALADPRVQRLVERGEEMGCVNLSELSELPRDELVVLGLPRGGVVIAYEVATALGAPLDVILVRKLGVPFQPELAMGAIGEGGAHVVDEAVARQVHVSASDLAAVEDRERDELAEAVASAE